MGADADVGVTVEGIPFEEFYGQAHPVVYGYLLRLCGGNHDDAWDLIQDSWIALVDRLANGQPEQATIAYLLSIARSRYLDKWRRQQRLQRKMRLVWAGARDPGPEDLSPDVVLDGMTECSDKHRVVLMLAYVDGLPVPEIATLLGSSISSTYSLISRARDELRTHLMDDPR